MVINETRKLADKRKIQILEGSEVWCCRFMKWQGLSVRTKTSIAYKKKCQLIIKIFLLNMPWWNGSRKICLCVFYSIKYDKYEITKYYHFRHILNEFFLAYEQNHQWICYKNLAFTESTAIDNWMISVLPNFILSLNLLSSLSRSLKSFYCDKRLSQIKFRWKTWQKFYTSMAMNDVCNSVFCAQVPDISSDNIRKWFKQLKAILGPFPLVWKALQLDFPTDSNWAHVRYRYISWVRSLFFN